MMDIRDRSSEFFNPKEVGEISESQVLALFLKHGYVVLTPFGDNQRYDLVVDDNGTFIRVQCKTANLWEDNSRFTFSCCSKNWNTRIRRDYKGEVEIFAVYLHEKDEVYMFRVDDCPTNSCSVRFVPPKNNQKKVRMAKDHLFDPSKHLMDYHPKTDHFVAPNKTRKIFVKKQKPKTPPKPRPTKIQWPLSDDLLKMVQDSNFCIIGRQLGVSDNAIRKRLKSRPPSLGT